MNITKQITVIDRDKVKVGDRLKLTNKEYDTVTYEMLVTEVQDDKLIFKISKDSVSTVGLSIEELYHYNIEKINSKTSRFKVGELYRIEDTLSCDRFDVIVLLAKDNMLSVMKIKTATGMDIKESDIDTTYKFTKLKTVIKDNMYDVKTGEVKARELDTDALVKDICGAIFGIKNKDSKVDFIEKRYNS